MCQGDNKGLWTALYGFGGLKVATGLVLVILGAIFMAYTPQDCDEIAKCFTEKGQALIWAIAHEDDCDESMKAIDDAANFIGTILLVIGVVGAFSGVLSFLSAKKRYRAYLGVSMGIDIVMMFASIGMYLACQASADIGKVICQELRDDAAKDNAVEACWKDLIDDVCSWTDMFLTATIMFLLMFIVEFATTIADCSACCCCPPHDASWSPQACKQQPASTGGQVIGQPVPTQPQKEP